MSRLVVSVVLLVFVLLVFPVSAIDCVSNETSWTVTCPSNPYDSSSYGCEWSPSAPHGFSATFPVSVTSVDISRYGDLTSSETCGDCGAPYFCADWGDGTYSCDLYTSVSLTSCQGNITPTPTPTPSYSQCVRKCGYPISSTCGNLYANYLQFVGDGLYTLGGCSLSEAQYANAAFLCPCANPDPSLVNTTPTPTVIITSTPTPQVTEYSPFPGGTRVYNIPPRDIHTNAGGAWEAPTVASKDSNITVSNNTIYDVVNFSPVQTLDRTLPAWVNESSYRSSLCDNQTSVASQFICPAINTFYNIASFVNSIIFGFLTLVVSPFVVFTNAYNWVFGLQENLLSAFASQIGIFVSIGYQVLASYPPKVINALSIFLALNLIEVIISRIREAGG